MTNVPIRHTILSKRELTAGLVRMEVHAPDVARKAQPGQFMMVRAVEEGERIPLTVADKDPQRGSVTLLFQAVGMTTRLMRDLPEGAALASITGPLGNPTHFGDARRVLCVGGGVGAAVLYPQVKHLAETGRGVDVIIGARNESLLVLTEEMGALARAVHLATDDGSRGTKGLVTDVLRDLLDRGEQYDLVIAIGPPVMMRAVAEFTRPLGIRTLVSLNPIMIDGTGMCGGCRVRVGGQIKYACVDGPEFDGHQVDFAMLMQRLRAYRDEEAQAVKDYECRGICSGTD